MPSNVREGIGLIFSYDKPALGSLLKLSNNYPSGINNALCLKLSHCALAVNDELRRRPRLTAKPLIFRVNIK
jgi:hypothetical protein